MKAYICARLAIAAALVCGAATTLPAQRPEKEASTGVADRLYTIDCGLTEFKDAAVFSDTGEYDGKPIALPTPCFLVRHGKDWLLWDTGNGDKLAALPNGITKFGGRFTMKKTLASQLALLGLKPDDIRYVALSHIHQDHAGNIGLFPKSTVLIPAAEIAYAHGKPMPFGVNPDHVAALDKAHVEPYDGDRDVFGDGSVRIFKGPGHTPGSAMLLVKLARSGPILLSGDIVHTRQNHDKGLVPSANTSRADSLASAQRLDRLAANYHARIVIQHAPEDYAAMPVLPKFLD